MILNPKRLAGKKPVPRPTNPASRLGLRYERQVLRALRELITPHQMTIEHNPAFSYRDEGGYHICIPDFVLHDNEFEFLVVVESKLTWTPLAEQKLRELYCPVVSGALHKPAKHLTIVKNLTLDSPHPSLRLSTALMSAHPLIHWIGKGVMEL